jgi:hypothetical protein
MGLEAGAQLREFRFPEGALDGEAAEVRSADYRGEAEDERPESSDGKAHRDAVTERSVHRSVGV